MEDISDFINLLNMVKSLLYQTTSQMYHPISLYLEKRSIYGLQEGPYMPNAQLVKNFKSGVEVLEDIGRGIGTDSKLVEYDLTRYLKEITVDPADATPAQTVEAKRCAREQYLVVILLCAVDHGRSVGRLP